MRIYNRFFVKDTNFGDKEVKKIGVIFLSFTIL